MNAGILVIETLRREGGVLIRGAAHLARAARTCAQLGYPFDAQAARAALLAAVAPAPGGPHRLRLTIAPDGTMDATAAALPPGPALWHVVIAPARLDPADPWLRIKTTRRATYDAARAALPPGVDEYLFLNTLGQVCEGTITNLFVETGAGLLTPPLSCGLLPGVLRAELLDSGRCREAVITPADLAQARLHVGNSLRGLIPARLGKA